MKSPHTYKFAFYAMVGMMLVFGYCLCSAQVIPLDKQYHAYGGAAIGAWSTRLPVDQTGMKPAIYGLSGAVIMGGSKELFDLAGGGTAEWADFGYTVLGGAISVGIIYGIKAIVKKRKRKTFKYHGN